MQNKMNFVAVHEGPKLKGGCTTSNLLHSPFLRCKIEYTETHITEKNIRLGVGIYPSIFGVAVHRLKLKGGCTRFEVEHVSHNLLLNTGLMLTKK